MIIDNTCSAPGDVLIFSTTSTIYGATDLSSFTDDITGTQPNRYFKKEFQYSLDGVVYSNWQDLTVTNLETIQLTRVSSLTFNFKYTREGNNTTELLVFNSLTIGATFVQPNIPAPPTSNTVFNDIFQNEFEIFDLCINLTTKLYYSGVIPEYFTRREKDYDLLEDEDYIAFWKTVSAFMALFPTYAKRFTNIYYRRDFLLEYIKEKGLYVCGDEDMSDLQFLVVTYFDQIRQRGTIMITKPKGYLYPDGSMMPVDGELLRLICLKEYDEFLFNLVRFEKFGWNIGNSSPMYKGLSDQIQVNKMPENTKDFIDLTKFNIIPGGSSSIVNIRSDGHGKNVFNVENIHIGETGGISTDESLDRTKVITVSPLIDYEITFQIWQTISNKPNLAFGVNFYDQFFNKYDGVDISTGFAANYFFKGIKMNQSTNGLYYNVRGIIYNTNRNLIPGSLTNLGLGANLKFPNERIKYINLILGVNNIAGGSGNSDGTFFYNLKMKPLSTPFSTGFIQSRNFIETWVKNNNFGKYDDDTVNDILRKYLLPYNCYFSVIQL